MTKSKYVINGGKRPKVDLGDAMAVEKMRIQIMQKHIDDLREERAEINNVIAMTLERIKDAKRVIYDLEKDHT